MQVRCPYYRSSVKLSGESSFSDVSCPSCGSSFSLIGNEETIDFEPSIKSIGRFAIIEEVGFGTFGSVFKATDSELDRTVAVKVPRKGELNPSEAEQFLREARTMATKVHSPRTLQRRDVHGRFFSHSQGGVVQSVAENGEAENEDF
jgi:serine/threonine protein kinase